MTDAEFDMKMCRLAKRDMVCEADSPRLERVLAELPNDAPRKTHVSRRRLAIALAATMLVCATAVAAQLGLPFFLEINPYHFFHQAAEPTADVPTQMLEIADASGLISLNVAALDSAWIEGRLTLTVRLTPTKLGETLYAGERNAEGTVNVYRHMEQPSEKLTLPEGAALLLYEDVTCYTLPEGAEGWMGRAERVACEADNDGLLLAIQLRPDFITAADLSGLTNESGRIPLRLELPVYTANMDDTALESVILSVCEPTETEREAMDS